MFIDLPTFNNQKKQANPLGRRLLVFGILILLCLSISTVQLFFTKTSFDDYITESRSGDWGNAASSSRKTSSLTQPVIDKQNSDSQATQNSAMTLGSITQLVNKNHGLPQDYEPADLVENNLPGIRTTYLRSEAANALAELFAEAQAQGFELQCCSGYRSYTTQVEVFDEEVALSGQAAAEMVSAQPGYSEHQTGLCIDLTSSSVNMTLTEEWINTPEGAWLDQNAWRFGFIIRYPKNKEAITGYTYEPWHIRYLGKDIAAAVFESGLTYEEYLGIE